MVSLTGGQVELRDGGELVGHRIFFFVSEINKASLWMT